MRYKLVVNMFFRDVNSISGHNVFRHMAEFEIDTDEKGDDSDLMSQIDAGVVSAKSEFEERMNRGVYQLVSTDTMFCHPVEHSNHG